MEINRSNYESYFLDYIEGNLDENLVDGFIEFLQNNPDLKHELVLAGDVKLPAEDVSFEGKEKLLKRRLDSPDAFNHAAIAFMEGDLSEEEKVEFEKYMASHPDMQKELLLFEKTRLKTSEDIVFHSKNKLYHYAPMRHVVVWSARVAAVVVAAFLVYKISGDFPVREQMPGEQVSILQREDAEPEGISEIEQEKKAPVPDTNETPVSSGKTYEVPKAADNFVRGEKDIAANEQTSGLRNPMEIPETISSLSASLHTPERMNVTLEHVKTVEPGLPESDPGERFLGDVVREKTGLANLSLNNITRAGLSLVSGISGEKFTYDTNSDGQVTELSFDSRLLAFSIPTGNR